MKHNNEIWTLIFKKISVRLLIYPGSRTGLGIPVLHPGNLL